MSKRKPESDLIRAAVSYLTLKGWHPIRVNAGLTVLGNGSSRRAIRGAKPGTSDIIACSPSGRFAAFEGKVKPNKPTDAQREFLDDVRKLGGIAGVFYDLDELDELMKQEDREVQCAEEQARAFDALRARADEYCSVRRAMKEAKR